METTMRDRSPLLPVPALTSRRDFLQQGAVMLGAASMLATSRPALAQVPANAAELDAKLFPGFEMRSIETNDVTLHTLIGGSGPPVLLLHGAPQSHLAWAQVAADLAKD